MNKKLIALSALVIGSGLLLTKIPEASAFRGDPTVMGPNYSQERHQEMTQAFENNDYEAWSELMQGRGRVTQVINEGNFESFAQMHQLMLEGDTEGANQIRAELGLGQGNGFGRQGMRRGGCANQ